MNIIQIIDKKRKKEELAIEEIRKRFGKNVIASMRVFTDTALSGIDADRYESEEL